MNAMPKEWRRTVAGPAPFDVLWARAQARAFLWSIGDIDMPEAVDQLETYAHDSGLVRELGQDAVQMFIGAAFQPYQREMAYA
jgi:hypothetical protein